MELRFGLRSNRRLQVGRIELFTYKKREVQNIRMLHQMAHKNLHHERKGEKRMGRLSFDLDIG